MSPIDEIGFYGMWTFNQQKYSESLIEARNNEVKITVCSFSIICK